MLLLVLSVVDVGITLVLVAPTMLRFGSLCLVDDANLSNPDVPVEVAGSFRMGQGADGCNLEDVASVFPTLDMIKPHLVHVNHVATAWCKCCGLRMLD